MKVVRLDEIEGLPVLGTLSWKPVRKTLGVSAFGINAYTAANAGDEVVEEHDETTLGHEEIYLVHTGHAVFTVDGEEIDAPAGTIVYLDDVTQRRHAIAKEAGTTVVAIGGVPGVHETSIWEYVFPAMVPSREGRHAEALAMLEQVLEERDHPAVHYNIACVAALSGDRERALEALTRAIEDGERFRAWAREDPDLASIRDDPRFPAA